MTPALFTRIDDHRVNAEGFSRGPWSEHALHGGPVAALVAGEAERLLGPSMHPSRVTIDLERPVPLGELQLSSSVVRPGRKVQVVEVEVRDPAGTRLVRASALGIRRGEVKLPDGAAGPAEILDRSGGPTAGPIEFRPLPLEYFHNDSVEWSSTDRSRPPEVSTWIRLTVPVIGGQPVSQLQRVAAAADFINGLSSPLAFGEWSFINPDLTISLLRLPVGEWIGLRALSRFDEQGVGLAEATLFDGQGRIGRATQHLIVEPLTL